MNRKDTPDLYRAFALDVARLCASPGCEDMSALLTPSDLPDLLEHLGQRVSPANGRAGVVVISEPYPVQVVRHRETGEAVLLLTRPGQGVFGLAACSITGITENRPQDTPWARFAAIVNYTEGCGDPDQALVTESAADIRETLERLKADRGGGE